MIGVGTTSRGRRLASLAGLYVLLSAVALVFLFPFVMAVTTSLKESQDVFQYPPTILPRQTQTTPVEGFDDEYPLYRVPVDGDQRTLALVESNVSMGIFAPPEDLDDTTVVPLSDAEPRGGFVDTETVEIDGETYDLFDVEVDGEVVAAVQVGRTTAGRFVEPDGSGEVVASVRASEPVGDLATQEENYTRVVQLRNMDRSLTNTILVTIAVVIGQVFTSVMGGYAFARLSFPGRDKLFLVYIGSFMIPFVVLIIPLYQIMVAIGWVDTLASLILPWVFTAYGTFLMRQFFVSIPRDLEEAAFVDGASHWTILWKVFVPLSWPAIATLATFGFLYAWNSFIWPLIVINPGNTDNHVLSLTLQILGGQATESPNLIFAGVIIAISVPIMVFLMAQRYFVENVASSGIK
jgi:ABC-type glycerol-3-phosphate transport system permease component